MPHQITVKGANKQFLLDAIQSYANSHNISAEVRMSLLGDLPEVNGSTLTNEAMREPHDFVVSITANPSLNTDPEAQENAGLYGVNYEIVKQRLDLAPLDKLVKFLTTKGFCAEIRENTFQNTGLPQIAARPWNLNGL